ncbi:hypothetical protein HWD97_21950 [Ochrobactrum sp. C6C9]|uniref:hypothetical protein n=1 Tax=Ochrobactrum sp. C6C9 TaxID=2736662 RepID=UPI00353023FA|nr:hypothetical protein [Ochrobactrum sp. C6C9]
MFSWSLAATKEGEPIMILRVPASGDHDSALSVSFPGRKKLVLVNFQGCDETVCVAMLPVGPVTREHIPVRMNETVDGRINVDPLVRRAAELIRSDVEASIFNGWHETVALVPELDGGSDRSDLVTSLQAHVREGRVSFLQNGQPIVEPEKVAACVTEHVENLTPPRAIPGKVYSGFRPELRGNKGIGYFEIQRKAEML